MNRLLRKVLFVALFAPLCSQAAEPVDYVNPYIGSISHLLVPCFPTIQLPNTHRRHQSSRAKCLQVECYARQRTASHHLDKLGS